MSNPPKMCRSDNSFYGYDPVDVVRVGSEGRPGVKGIKGEKGEKGEQGAPGSGGDRHYRHVQNASATIWDVSHNMGKFPAVTVVDSGGSQVEGGVSYVDQNRVILTFSAAFSGEAFFN